MLNAARPQTEAAEHPQLPDVAQRVGRGRLELDLDLGWNVLGRHGAVRA
jgi:hypothetical protein